MKILFAALALPFPPTNGQRLRNRALLRALREEGHEVSLISFADQDAPATDGEMKELCRSVAFVPPPFPGGDHIHAYRTRLRSIFSPLPHGAWRNRSAPMRSAIEQHLRREKFDLIFCDDIYNLQNLPSTNGVPVVLNKHDITHVIVGRYLACEWNPVKLSYGWIEYVKLRRWEAQACSSCAEIFTCSELDREVLKALCPESKFAVVPNVIDTDEYTPASSDDGNTVIYIGALDWLPNQDAAEFFVKSIFPRLHQLAPKARFRVVGRNAPRELRRHLAGLDGVELLGWVPDVRTEMARAAVCVVPLRIGSGTRLKILEAAAMGKPIVSTRIGAEGLNFREGKEILLADKPDEFARAVADLLEDQARRRALGEAARQWVEERYGIPALRSALREALCPFAGRPLAARQTRRANQPFIVFGDEWGLHPSSDQHLVRRIARTNPVLYVNTIGLRPPSWSTYDLRRALGKLRQWLLTSGKRRAKDLPSGHLYSPIMFPLNMFRPIRRWNRRVLIDGVRRQMKAHGFESPILFVSSPIGAEVLGAVDEQLVIYYVHDQYTALPGVDTEYIGELEQTLLDRADLIFVTSVALLREKNGKKTQPLLLPHGVDFAHFQRAVEPLGPMPVELRGLPRPLLGFFGLLAPWVDFDLFEHLARALPEASIVLIGPRWGACAVPDRIPNLHWLGPRSYDELPRYAAHFDVGLIPFRQDRVTAYVNPLKFLEYLALGLPVVSTPLPDLPHSAEVVFEAHSHEEFVQQVKRALCDTAPGRRQQRFALAARESWEYRVATIWNRIEEALRLERL